MRARRNADVEDVVSLALSEIDRSLHTFDPGQAPLRVWMYRVVERTARRYARKGRSLASRMVPWEDVEDLEGIMGPAEELMTTTVAGAIGLGLTFSGFANLHWKSQLYRLGLGLAGGLLGACASEAMRMPRV